MSDFVPQDVIVSTPCHHVFHKSCFNEWLELARTCPVCRTDIPNSLGLVHPGHDTGDQERNGGQTEMRRFPWRPTFSSDGRNPLRRLNVDDVVENTTNRAGDDGSEEEVSLASYVSDGSSSSSSVSQRQRITGSSHLDLSNGMISADSSSRSGIASVVLPLRDDA